MLNPTVGNGNAWCSFRLSVRNVLSRAKPKREQKTIRRTKFLCFFKIVLDGKSTSSNVIFTKFRSALRELEENEVEWSPMQIDTYVWATYILNEHKLDRSKLKELLDTLSPLLAMEGLASHDINITRSHYFEILQRHDELGSDNPQ